MMAEEDIKLEVRDQIAILTFNRPQVRNSLTFDMYHRLGEICQAPPEGAKAMIITGAGDRAFAAGTDISQFRDFTTPEQAIEYEATMDEVLEAVECCPIPTIAAINDACTGGGGVIAAACDIRICDQRLKFGFPIARTLGNCLSAANINRLEILIGAGRVREIIFTCRLIEAQEALNVGLVSQVLDTAADVEQRAWALAVQVAGHAPLTLRATKEIQRRLALTQCKDRDWIVKCYTSEDFREGLDAFLTKRPPTWQGK